MKKYNAFNVKLYNDNKEEISNEDFVSIADIVKAYPNISYNSLYYIAHYKAKGRKPSSKMVKMMDRIMITQLDQPDLFERAEN